jgi:glycosyltransferase involved in cell wall biosynthesis
MVKITLVDDTDLSIVGTGQQAYTYGLFSKVANFAEVVLITQSLRDPARLSWASKIKVVKCLPGRLGVNLCSHTSLSEIVSSAKDSDVIIAEHIYGINRWAPLASRLLRIPFIYHSHGNEIETSNTVKQKLFIFPIEKYIYKSSDLIIAISEITIINAIKTYKLRGKRYAVLPPGLREVHCANNQALRDKLRLWGIRDDELIVVMHGSMDYGPNADALNMLTKLSNNTRERYGVVFVIAGKSSKLRLGWVTRDILYIGFLRDIDELLCIADAAIAPIISGTGIHMKVIDYLSAGLPLITTPKALEGLPLHALSEYPLLLIKSNIINNIDLGKLISKFLLRKRGPFSGQAKIPTYDVLARSFLNIIYDIIKDASKVN